ncbi:hypothetical protein ABXT08_17810 [Chryseobacterium sp. NRRL B-14859]|uniref:hypothetical protein n=1 Tax=Chryseobacterium sp. NRRL B-14859 TaxID=1562763 RepID=UPI0033987FA0
MINNLFLSLVFCFFIAANCSNKQNYLKTDKTVQCKNDARLYSSLNKNNLLFKDSASRVYLRVENVILKDSNLPLSECQKLPYIFVNEMALANDSIVTLDHIVDVNTFSKIKNTKNYFIDKKRVYYYKNDIATYPNLYELKIEISKLKVIDFETIQDDNNTYIRGVRK